MPLPQLVNDPGLVHLALPTMTSDSPTVNEVREVSEQTVLDALRHAREPELRRDLVGLDLVRSIEVRGRDVRVVLATKVEDDPIEALVVAAARGAIANRTTAAHVEVVVRSLDDDEQLLLATRLRADDQPHERAGEGGHGHAQGPTTAPSFMQVGSRTRVIGVTSGKGGVGKSSTTVNLGIALANRGLDVGILDADVYGFSVPKMLGIDRTPSMIDRLVIPPLQYGVTAMSMGFFVEEDRAIIWRGPMLHKALEQFLNEVYWGEPDVILVDMPPGTGDVALSMAQYLPRSEIVVVTTPQAAAQRVAQRAATMARTPQINLSVLGVIENMSWFTGDDSKRYEIFGSGGGESLANDLGVPLLGQIPLVPELREGMDIGVPITVADPTSEASVAYQRLAERLATELLPKRRYSKSLKLG